MTDVMPFKLRDTEDALADLDDAVDKFISHRNIKPVRIDIGAWGLTGYRMSTGKEPALGKTVRWGRHTVTFAYSPTNRIVA